MCFDAAAFLSVLQGRFAVTLDTQVGIVGIERPDDFKVSLPGGVMQGRFSVRRLRVHVCALREEEFGHLRVAAAGRHVQDRPCVAARTRADYLRFGLKQLRHLFEVSRNHGGHNPQALVDATAGPAAFLRKFGLEQAEKVRLRAEPYEQQLREAQDPALSKDALLAFDEALKTEGLNPGTSADMTVATLLAYELEALLEEDGGSTGRAP